MTQADIDSEEHDEHDRRSDKQEAHRVDELAKDARPRFGWTHQMCRTDDGEGGNGRDRVCEQLVSESPQPSLSHRCPR